MSPRKSTVDKSQRPPDHRKPQLPHWNAPKGSCRWCGDFIWQADGMTLNLRRHWHDHCVDAYKQASWPQYARRLVYRRDKGRCAACGVTHRKQWELDHIVPLIDGGGFDLENMQTLCIPCHRQKTAQEASSRSQKVKRVHIECTPNPQEADSLSWLNEDWECAQDC